MTYLLSRIRAAVAALDVIMLAVALTFAAFHVWPGWLYEAREEGALGERIVWQERQRRADAKAEQDRKAAQDKINAASAELINALASSAIRENELQAAIAEMERQADDENETDAGARPVCPAMPAGVRDALNRIGR